VRQYGRLSWRQLGFLLPIVSYNIVDAVNDTMCVCVFLCVGRRRIAGLSTLQCCHLIYISSVYLILI